MVYNRVQDCIVLLFGKHLTKMNRYDVFVFIKKDKFFVFVFHFFRIFVVYINLVFRLGVVVKRPLSFKVEIYQKTPMESTRT